MLPAGAPNQEALCQYRPMGYDPSPRAASPRSPMGLMFTFDGEEGDELCLCLEGTTRTALEGVAANATCHKYMPISSLLGPGAEVDLTSGMLSQHEEGQAKAAQLLMQWLALPTTETLLSLILSNVRRSLPISRDIALERGLTRSSLPLAPVSLRSRWSVSGGTPRQPPVASPSIGGAQPLRQRRKSEPTLPTVAFATPPGMRQPRLSFDDCSTSSATTAGTPRRTSGSLRSPNDISEARAAEVVHSPLSYFGTQPNVSSRFLQVPQGDGGLQVS